MPLRLRATVYRSLLPAARCNSLENDVWKRGLHVGRNWVRLVMFRTRGLSCKAVIYIDLCMVSRSGNWVRLFRFVQPQGDARESGRPLVRVWVLGGHVGPPLRAVGKGGKWVCLLGRLRGDGWRKWFNCKGLVLVWRGGNWVRSFKNDSHSGGTEGREVFCRNSLITGFIAAIF
jgi:hypothetical protein